MFVVDRSNCYSFLFRYLVFIVWLYKVSRGKLRLFFSNRGLCHSHAAVTVTYTLSPKSGHASHTL